MVSLDAIVSAFGVRGKKTAWKVWDAFKHLLLMENTVSEWTLSELE